ncbi:MAG TPA: zinc ribbon domain-containing protein [Candidatus Angelobacter sp.]|nr:zinc ribbon domain-containing protein [Candidatus Angelobacter sp.]
MQCAFCGTENRPEYKFCGMCGVKLERRQAERRAQSGVSIKCDSCGHMNDPGLKFCGMCGTRIERRLQERRGAGGEQARAAAIANAQLPRPDIARNPPPRTAVAAPPVDLPAPGVRRGDPAIFHDESAKTANAPHISGPSFLGLNSQPEEGSGEYLLEDEPSGGGLRKLILLLILAAIVGLVFIQWRSSFKASPKPVPAKTEPSPATAPQGNNQAPTTNNTDPQAKNADVKNADVKDNSGAGAASADEAKTEADTPIAAVPANAKATADDPAADSGSKDAESKDSKDADNKDADSKKPPESDGKPGPSAKAIDDSRIPDHKPSAALVRAQQFLQGRGVPQNCEQGMLYLRAATEKNDPEAAIQMAALYSSGLCVKQDRVMAYRWFNSAHELEPANTWIQRNMDQLWAQMTSQERRLAGY